MRISGPRVYVRAALEVADADERRCVGPCVYNEWVKGIVKAPLPAKSDLWAKLVPITGAEDNLMDFKVDKDGRFEFLGMSPGNYLLLILDGRRVVATAQLEDVFKKEVRIKLP